MEGQPVVVVSCSKRSIKHIRDVLKLRDYVSESYDVSPCAGSDRVLVPVKCGVTVEDVEELLAADQTRHAEYTEFGATVRSELSEVNSVQASFQTFIQHSIRCLSNFALP